MSEKNQSNKSILIISIVSILLIALIIILAKSTSSTNESYNEINQIEMDSISKTKILTQSIEDSLKNDSLKTINENLIKELKPLFKIKKDEYSTDNREIYKPKSAPIYVNENGFYTYFQVNNEQASNFRLRLQYLADSWLFIQKVQFSIDGKPYEFIPMNVERDNDSEIWEWFDENITDYNDKQLIEALANAKEAKMKIIGKQYHEEKFISKSQLNSIKKSLELYKAMNGNW